MDSGGIVPEGYEGREQAIVKHTLLKSYLEKLFFIVGQGSAKNGHVDLCYVDCFAGPWGDESENLSKTSIAISLDVLSKCGKALRQFGISAHIRAIYIEKNAKAFARLQNHLATNTPGGVEAIPLSGDFIDLRDELLSRLSKDSFAFFFIDPKGWTEVTINNLKPLLMRPKSEFLINFMYDFVNRTMSMTAWAAEMRELVGETLELTNLEPKHRERLILSTYRSNLKGCLPVSNSKFPARSAYVRVLDTGKARTKYHLVYLTSHSRGIVEFMQISERVDIVQKQVRASLRDNAKEQLTGIVDMFADEVFVDTEEGRATPNDVDRYWLDFIGDSDRLVDQAVFATILEDSDWFPSDLQASLSRLTAAGNVENMDSTSKRPKKPLHFAGKGERLRKLKSKQP